MNTDSHAARIVEYAEHAQRYKANLKELTKLSSTLKQQPPSSFVNLFDVFRSHNIRDRSRVDTHASEQITKAVSSFVGKGIYEELESRASKDVSSSKHVQHKIMGCKLQQDVSTYIARATVTTATRGTDDDARVDIKEALLAQLFVVWASVCLPLIEAERKALQQDAKHVHGLIAVVQRAIGVLNNSERHGKPKSASRYACFFKSVCRSHKHTAERIRIDQWFTSSKTLWPSEALSSISVFVEWFEEYGSAFHKTLVKDYNRLQMLCAEPADSSAWYGVEVVDTVSNPMGVFLFNPPSYIGRFETSSGKVYARYEAVNGGQSITRALTLVQTFWVVHEIIQREWLPFRFVSAAYALDLVESEIQLYSFTVQGITKELTQICKDAGYNVEEERLDKIVYDVCSKYTQSLHHRVVRTASNLSIQTTSATCVDSYMDKQLSKSKRVMSIPTKQPADTLCTFRDKSCPFRPDCVHWRSLLDYFVIHALAQEVSQSIDYGRGRRVVCDITINSQKLIGIVESYFIDAIQREHCVETREMLLQTCNKASLRQCIPAVIKSLLHVGSHACTDMNVLTPSSCVLWNTTYKEERNKGGMLLTIGYGSNDPMAFIFFNLCSRIKGWLDQSWPLPFGVHWDVKRQRPSTASMIKRPHAYKNTTDAEDDESVSTAL